MNVEQQQHAKCFETLSFFSGFARTDCALVMNWLFSNGIISPQRLVVRSELFKSTLRSSDKGDWFPEIRENSFDNKLPGTITQNKKWIQFLSLMIYPELLKNPAFVKSKYWKLYILLKKVCQYFLASRLSDYQVDQQTAVFVCASVFDRF